MERIHGRLLPILLASVVAFVAAAPAQGQFVPLSRCRAALPCAIPFQIEYRPDPLIAAHYGFMRADSISAHLALVRGARFELDRREPVDREAVEAAVRSYFRRHPAPQRRTAPARALVR